VLYNCSSCQQTFKKWTELRKHIQNDHPIQCTICNKVYTKAFNLKQHIKEKHIEQETIQCDWPGCDSVLETVSLCIYIIVILVLIPFNYRNEVLKCMLLLSMNKIPDIDVIYVIKGFHINLCLKDIEDLIRL
jgi:DNA-directed RNA polymerase subunit RPC12/RpoP